MKNKEFYNDSTYVDKKNFRLISHFFSLLRILRNYLIFKIFFLKNSWSFQSLQEKKLFQAFEID